MLFPAPQSLAGTTWPTALGFNVGNECSWPFFRCFAYINEKFRAWSKANGGLQKDLYTFITSGQSWWRSIYEDQSNGNPPPPLQNESIASLVGYNFYNPDGRKIRSPVVQIMTFFQDSPGSQVAARLPESLPRFPAQISHVVGCRSQGFSSLVMQYPRRSRTRVLFSKAGLP